MGHKYGDDRLWAVDEYIEEQKFLNINRVLEPYPGAYCGYVHEEDIAEALP